jgi:hypothetical protein
MSTEKIKELIEIYDQFLTNKNTRKLSKWKPVELYELTNFLPENSSLNVRMYHLKNNLFCVPKCEECNMNETKFCNDCHCYRKFCGRKCAANNQNTKDNKQKAVKEKYGNEHYFHTDDYKEKAKETIKKKYGVDHPNKNEIIKEKRKQTCLEKFGETTNLKCAETKEKIKNTMIERYGVDNPSKSPELLQKIHKKMSVTYKEHLPEILEKRKQTNMKRYGRPDSAQMHLTLENVKLSYNKEWLLEQNKLYPVCYIAKKLGMGLSQLCIRFKYLNLPINPYHSISSIHQQILDYILELYDGELIINDRKLLNKKELDIILPELNLSFEVNGTYWHSEENGKDKNYHLNKTLLCAEKGIQLIHIFEYELTHKLNVVKHNISSLLGKLEPVDSNTLNFIEIKRNEAEEFFNCNNLYNFINSDYYFALVNSNKDIYMCVSIKSNDNELEVTQLQNKCGYVIENGLQIIIKNLKELFSNILLIIKEDKCWFVNDYSKFGFTYLTSTEPTFVTISNKHKVWNCGYLLFYIQL